MTGVVIPVVAALLGALAACSSSGTAVTGDVFKTDSVALPADAVVTVELRDTSLAELLITRSSLSHGTIPILNCSR